VRLFQGAQIRGLIRNALWQTSMILDSKNMHFTIFQRTVQVPSAFGKRLQTEYALYHTRAHRTRQYGPQVRFQVLQKNTSGSRLDRTRD
jgi:hypothetical protein